MVSQKVQFPLGHGAIYRISSYKTLQMRFLLESTTFSLYVHKIIRIAEIIRIAGIIQIKGGYILYEEIR